MKKVLMMAAALTVISMPAMANETTYSEIDTNGDGAISKAEYDAHKDSMFEKADTNKDGSLSKEEMTSMARAKWDAAKNKMKDAKDKVKPKTE